MAGHALEPAWCRSAAGRIVDTNARWDAVWGEVGPAQRSTVRARTAQRRTARAQPPPRSKQVIGGKPLATYCWCRFRLAYSPRFPAL